MFFSFQSCRCSNHDPFLSLACWVPCSLFHAFYLPWHEMAYCSDFFPKWVSVSRQWLPLWQRAPPRVSQDRDRPSMACFCVCASLVEVRCACSITRLMDACAQCGDGAKNRWNFFVNCMQKWHRRTVLVEMDRTAHSVSEVTCQVQMSYILTPVGRDSQYCSGCFGYGWLWC